MKTQLLIITISGHPVIQQHLKDCKHSSKRNASWYAVDLSTGLSVHIFVSLLAGANSVSQMMQCKTNKCTNNIFFNMLTALSFWKDYVDDFTKKQTN